LTSQNASLAAPFPEITFSNQTPYCLDKRNHQGSLVSAVSQEKYSHDYRTWSLAQAISRILLDWKTSHA